jgi:hypothetical protein
MNMMRAAGSAFRNSWVAAVVFAAVRTWSEAGVSESICHLNSVAQLHDQRYAIRSGYAVVAASAVGILQRRKKLSVVSKVKVPLRNK